MGKYNKNVHIGNLIQERLKQRGLSYARFARLINCDRTTVYNIIRAKSIDIDRLIRISEVLDFDFIGIYTAKMEKENTMKLQIEQKDRDCLLRIGIAELSIEIKPVLPAKVGRPHRTISAESADTPIED